MIERALNEEQQSISDYRRKGRSIGS